METTLTSTVDGGKALHGNLLNACNSTSLQMAMPRKKNTKNAQGNDDHRATGKPNSDARCTRERKLKRWVKKKQKKLKRW